MSFIVTYVQVRPKVTTPFYSDSSTAAKVRVQRMIELTDAAHGFKSRRVAISADRLTLTVQVRWTTQHNYDAFEHRNRHESRSLELDQQEFNHVSNVRSHTKLPSQHKKPHRS